MINDFTVEVTRKGGKSSVSYPLIDYCNILKGDIANVIGLVEYMLIEQYGTKEHWPAAASDSFQAIRKKLLDASNSVNRLPSEIKYKGQRIDSVPADAFIAALLNNAASK